MATKMIANMIFWKEPCLKTFVLKGWQLHLNSIFLAVDRYSTARKSVLQLFRQSVVFL